MDSKQEEQLVGQEPTGMEMVRGLETMLGREPTREELLVALGVPMAYKDHSVQVEQHIAPYLAKEGRTKVSSLVEKVAPTNEDMLLGEMIACYTQWHIDRNLVHGTTDQKQFVKLMEEVIELYMSINFGTSPEQALFELKNMVDKIHFGGRIKAAENDCILDDVGDINVVLVNLLARREQSMGQSLVAAWNDIKDREGKMIDGTFVKQSDL